MSSSYKLSKQQDRAGVGGGGVDRCERFAGGRGAGESDLLAIAEQKTEKYLRAESSRVTTSRVRRPKAIEQGFDGTVPRS